MGIALGRRLSVVAMIIELLVLTVTGGWLSVSYDPTTGDASHWVQAVHRNASIFLVVTTLIVLVDWLLERMGLGRKAGRSWISAALALAGACSAAAIYTGFRLPWSQVGYWAFPGHGNVRGYRPFFSELARFGLVNGVAVTPGSMVGWLFGHLLLGVATAVLLVPVCVLWFPRRAAPRSSDPAGPGPVDEAEPESDLAEWVT